MEQPSKPSVDPSESEAQSAIPVCEIAVPEECRTDPGRGTGELGTEGMDPSRPLMKDDASVSDGPDQ